jgi:hypothetical protein
VLTASSGVIGFLLLRTLWLLVRGKLIPALPPQMAKH